MAFWYLTQDNSPKQPLKHWFLWQHVIPAWFPADWCLFDDRLILCTEGGLLLHLLCCESADRVLVFGFGPILTCSSPLDSTLCLSIVVLYCTKRFSWSKSVLCLNCKVIPLCMCVCVWFSCLKCTEARVVAVNGNWKVRYKLRTIIDLCCFFLFLLCRAWLHCITAVMTRNLLKNPYGEGKMSFSSWRIGHDVNGGNWGQQPMVWSRYLNNR